MSNRPSKRLSVHVSRITADWHALFPQFAVYEPLRLMRRIGPLVQGIWLMRQSDGESYAPCLHVEDLCAETRLRGASLPQLLRTRRTGASDKIHVSHHDRFYKDASERLVGRSVLPVSGDFTALDVVRAYATYRALGEMDSLSPVRYFESAIRLLAWCGDLERGLAVLAEFARELRRPESESEIMFPPPDLEQWESCMEGLLRDPEGVRDMVASNVAALKLGALPFSALHCGGG